MITITTVSNNDELEQIIQLSRKNLRTNISPDEKQKEGFITWEYNKQLLQQLHALAPSVIAKENDEVIGYAITTLLAAGEFHPDLQLMINGLKAFHSITNHYLIIKLISWDRFVLIKIIVGREFSMLYIKSIKRSIVTNLNYS
jgi:hypothetical protein